MNWFIDFLIWYFYLLVLGVIFYPFIKKIFSRFNFDFAYPFSKTLAIIVISYISYVLSTLRLIQFSRINLFIITISLFFISYFFLKNKLKTNYKIVIFEELIFFLSFLFWTYVRSQEPSIQSLEKFMDFGFINSILRADYFPPKDMWYPPEPINYYYFGHLTGAVLIKLTNINPNIGYNLILATIFGLSISQVFSIIANIINYYQISIKKINLKINYLKIIIYGLIGAFVVNLGGNLHTIYLFTKGYPNDNPIPFWQILSGYNPLNYWYPNATRFIPYTIHEFPSYSYVVADLHGHVFDIPFVLLTLSFLFLFFTNKKKSTNLKINFSFLRKKTSLIINKIEILSLIFIGFLISIHYMTNAFDGPIYFLLTNLILFFMFGISWKLFFYLLTLLISFVIFNLPFSSHFSPFVSGIGVNCSPDFLTNLGKLGPFLFEKDNCQISPLWMLLILWGFFWLNFTIFLIIQNKNELKINLHLKSFLTILFSFGTLLIIIPEFFYIKDIYPQHFRANTMFKLGYQAFIMMGIASIIILFLIKNLKNKLLKFSLLVVYFPFLLLICIYPYYAIPSYYGKLDRRPTLDGSNWLAISKPEDKEIIDYLNKNIKGQPVILEAQGDSYTDYERISAFTGLPTVAGWWVHEWLWRGSPDFVGQRIPDIQNIYESNEYQLTKTLIKKYQIKYIIVSNMERLKYPNLNEEKFEKIGKLIFRSSNNFGTIYQVD